MEIGAQLYTVREHCKTLDDFALTLRKIADIGYKTVQVSGVCPFEPEWLQSQLKQNGLKCVITHTDGARICTEPEKVAAEHDVFECNYVGLGSYGFNPDRGESLEHLLATYREPAEKLKACGKYFMYHNHAAEYENEINGKNCMEYLSDNFAPEEMGFTLDTYWVKKGGYDPVEEIKRLKGRLPCVHFKDMAVEADGEKHFTWCGNGILDFSSIGQALKDAGTDYIFIEQDKTFACEPDPFKCLEKSKKYLSSIGFEF